MDKCVLILSGGLDSTTLLYSLLKRGKKKVYPISFYYGQKHSKELECAKATCDRLQLKHKLADIEVLGELAPSSLTRDEEVPKGHYQEESMKSTVVPNRNMVLLSLAASYAIGIGADTLYYGAHGGDHAIYPDCRPEFVEIMKEAFMLCDWKNLRLEVPYLFMSKVSIVEQGLTLKVDYASTWTCYEGRDKPCGLCGACTERLEAFKLNGVKDPLEYE